MQYIFTKKSFLGLILATLLFSGCKKETPEPDSCTDSCILQLNWDHGFIRKYMVDGSNRLISISSSDTAGTQNLTTTYTYDGAGHVVTMASVQQGQNLDRYEFTYSGDRIASSRYCEFWPDGRETNIVNSVFFYDSQGRNDRRLMYEGETQDKLIQESEYVFDTRGNVIRSTEYNVSQTKGKTLRSIWEYTFDDKPNPVAGLPLLGMPGLVAQVNNPLTLRTASTNGVFSPTTEFSYEYNSDSIPVRQRVISRDSLYWEPVNYTYGCKWSKPQSSSH